MRTSLPRVFLFLLLFAGFVSNAPGSTDQEFLKECLLTLDALPGGDHIVLDLEASPDVVDQLIDDLPNVAVLLLALDKSSLAPDDEGVTVVWGGGQHCYHALSGKMSSPDFVRKLFGLGIFAGGALEQESIQLNRPLPQGTTLVTRSWFSQAPDGQPQLTVRSILVKWIPVDPDEGKLPDAEVIEVVGEARLALKLVKEDAYPIARDKDKFAHLYEIVEIIEQIPAHKPDLASN